MRRRRGACMDRAEDYHRNVHRADAVSTVIHHVAERARATGGLQRSGSLPRLRGCAHPNVRRACSRHHSQRHVVIGTPSSAAAWEAAAFAASDTPSAVLRAASASRPAPTPQVWLLLPTRSYLGEQRPIRATGPSRSATRAEYAWRSRRASEWQRPSWLWSRRHLGRAS